MNKVNILNYRVVLNSCILCLNDINLCCTILCDYYLGKWSRRLPVNILFLVMYYIASAFYVQWFIKDDVHSRARLPIAIILILIATSLIAIWNIYYFTVL